MKVIRVAIYGSDGSGKTTILDVVKERLGKQGHPVHSNHWRPYLLSKPKTITDISNPHSVRIAGQFRSMLKTGFYLMDFWLGRIRESVILHKEGTRTQIVLHERFFLDVLFDGERFGLNLPDWFKRFIVWFAPPVSINLGLVGDPAKLYERKPETSLEAVGSQCRAIKTVLGRKRNALILDTVKNGPDASADAILSAIFQK